MGVLVTMVRFAWELAVTTVEAVLWLVHGIRQLALILWDGARGLWSVRGGVLRCPQGHTFALSGDDLAYDFECGGCGWTWSGKFGTELRCMNPECEQPTAPFVACPECGLSVRNPFRWGRP